jgi:5'(3')-deoxyribonucleotidase
MERLLNNRDFWASIPPIPGAIPGVEYLRSLNFNIQWVTSPWYSCLDWDGTRRLWLRRHFGATPDQVTITSRKDLVRGIALIDDKPRHVKEWYDRNPAGLAILYAQPYNRGTLRDDFTDRMNWSDIPDSFKTFRMLLEQRREEEHLKWRQYRRIQP